MSGILRIDMRQVEEAMETLSHLDGAFEPVLVKSLNKALNTARNEAIKNVKKRYTIEDDGLKNQLKLRKARNGDMEAYFTNASSPNPIDKFSINPKHPDGRRRKPIAAEVVFGDRNELEDSFVAEMQNTKVGVFRRVGRERLPIKMFYGPSLAQMLSHDAVVNPTEKKSSKVMSKELEAGIDRVIKQVSGVSK